MKTQTNDSPTVAIRTATNVRPVAAPLRRTSDEKNVPSAPNAIAVTNRTAYPRTTSSGATPP